jgi:hypothetical protein
VVLENALEDVFIELTSAAHLYVRKDSIKIAMNKLKKI